MTVGSAGAPVKGGAGGAGGQSSFGTYFIVPGGAGGFIGQAGAGISAGVDMDAGSASSGSAHAFGSPAAVGVGPLSLSSTVGQGTMKSGRGADSKLGVGGGGTAVGLSASVTTWAEMVPVEFSSSRNMHNEQLRFNQRWIGRECRGLGW